MLTRSLALLVLMQWSQHTEAVEYRLNPSSRIVGNQTSYLPAPTDTLFSIAQKHLLGLGSITLANPDLDTNVPGVGADVQLPTVNILPTSQPRGIVINLPELRLYHYTDDGSRVSIYPIGIGKQGWDTPLMNDRITSIVKNPTWTPPASIKQAYLDAGKTLPDIVPAGADNPLGEYALRIGQSSYLIHGTNKPEGVGLRVSHGCIRMYPTHIAQLAKAVDTATEVRVINQPIKMARHGKNIYLQAFPRLIGGHYNHRDALHTFFEQAQLELTPEELQLLKGFIKNKMIDNSFFTGLLHTVPLQTIRERL